MNRPKIGLIGALGNNQETSSGQIIRTRILVDSLQNRYGVSSIIVANTSMISSKPLNFILNFLLIFFSANKCIVMVSQNGMRLIWPILSIWSKYFGKSIYNNIIGGNILLLLDKYPALLKYMKTYSVNWVQMKAIQIELEKKQVINTEWLPNAKPIIPLRMNDINWRNDVPLRFCTFSRISREKGIERAINAIQQVNREAGRVVATLDIFGKPDEGYEADFMKLMDTVQDSIRYKGLIKYNQSVQTLKNYFMLLFPTTFDGEGFPGTIIDANASATPVIASNWRFNSDLIEDNVTGLIYNYKDSLQLVDKINWAISHSEEVENMRVACLKEFDKYRIHNVLSKIFNRLD